MVPISVSLTRCMQVVAVHQNVQVGDICLIRYRKETRATYRMGRIHEVRRGVDGLVRSVVLQYKLPNEKVFRKVDRPIHGICVIVPVEEQQLVAVITQFRVQLTIKFRRVN